MKKYLLGCLFFLVTLTACSAKTEEKSYYLNSNGNETEITYYFENDIAIKQATVSKVSYENLNVSNEEEARKALASTNEMYDNNKGISHSIEYNEDYLVEKISVDYKDIDEEDMEQLAILVGNSSGADELTPEKIDESMEGLGFKNSESKESIEKEIAEYTKTISNFSSVSVEDILGIKDEKIILYVGYKECPYCRIFAPKLLEASSDTNAEIFYLDTTTIGESPDEEEFIEELALETVPALFVIENGKKVKTFEFESSAEVTVQEMAKFLKNK